MDKRFEKRLKYAKNPRLRKHNVKRKLGFKRPTSHVASFIGDVKDNFIRKHGAVAQCARLSASASEGSSDSFRWPSRGATVHALFDMVGKPLALAAGLAAAAGADAIDAIQQKREAKKLAIKRKAALAIRQRYYAADAAKRERQRKEIEAARAKPCNRCPTPEELEEAYRRRRENDNWKERFGTLMIDLEEHVRRTFLINGNKFTGSQGGVRNWLSKNSPLLAKHYSTCLHYKRLLQDDPYDEE